MRIELLARYGLGHCLQSKLVNNLSQINQNLKLLKGLQYNEKIVVPLHKDIILENYNSNISIKAPLAT